MLGAGLLNEQIVIKRAIDVQNDSGGFDTTFTPILTTYANVQQKSLSNDLIAQQPELIGTFEVTIRKRAIDILKDDKIEWRGKDCEIIAFPQIHSREYIKILIRTDATY